jgi:hypothetical protein
MMIGLIKSALIFGYENLYIPLLTLRYLCNTVVAIYYFLHFNLCFRKFVLYKRKLCLGCVNL